MKLPEWARRGRGMWRWTGQARPPFAVAPGPSQESVWDYPRPPRMVADSRKVEVRRGSIVLACTERAIRMLETASPPTFYLPPEDITLTHLRPTRFASGCEWKGEARYWTVEAGGPPLERVAWSYPDPFGEYEKIRGYLAFYPAALECVVAGERVRAQPGGFYAGWVTDEIVGPFKGEPGSEGW